MSKWLEMVLNSGSSGIRDSFNDRKSFKEIADDFQRTEKAIISKLVFLGLIEDPYQR
ncbi:hypothetical protein HBN50_03305 [Halobacteriovorax sp. GB3]|uniref:hypothetical protein n=1 Tax=Halobacteriovorax sp. GB3 TaxID=2719615 RepID=UPI0023626D62|nr:hypothetical protein [Halobacteriovorax sp. GB3]MDD0852104.1 hypothetical protein [Halobacteriovorax sp. GB3]